jgi:pantetheine-phosphate adenylyltransferase
VEAPNETQIRRHEAVYAGTFDPITLGHRDIVMRALGVFDHVYVGVARSTGKTPLFSDDERLVLTKQALADLGPRVSVELFDGLLVDCVRSLDCRVIVRGLRAVTDYEYEAQIAVTNHHLAEDIETVFFMTSLECAFISSSIVRAVAKNGGNVRGLVTPNVAKALEQKFKRPE